MNHKIVLQRRHGEWCNVCVNCGLQTSSLDKGEQKELEQRFGSEDSPLWAGQPAAYHESYDCERMSDHV